MNIEDDLEYLTGSSFFVDNIGKLMTLENFNAEDIYFDKYNTRKYRQKLIFNTIEENVKIVVDEEIESDVESDLVIENFNQEISVPGEVIYEKPKLTHNIQDDEISDDSSIDTSDNSDLNYSTCSDIDNDKKSKTSNSSVDSYSDDESLSTDEEDDTFAYIHDFPIQMICLEKLEGTLDLLFLKEEIDEKNGSAILLQIIMTLLVYQKVFDFTHNDLHTNNIMYVTTTKKFLWYKFENSYYKVPTYGKIFKIIDFGRSIYKFQGKQFCSDSFAPGGDGATQYNFKPFLDNDKPVIEPNQSFDLCRLACSIYDFLIYDDTDMERLDGLQKTIERWVTDDNGHNILYKRNGEERYEGFKLYKMIARITHKHTPKAQLQDPFFKQFLVNKKKVKQIISTIDEIMDIDNLPSYI
jgi:hypothetical protein